MIERLSCDLEKVFAVCFTDQCLARLKQSFSLFPPRKLLIWGVNSSIAQSHCCISNDVKAKLSRKFHGEMTFLHPRSLSTLNQWKFALVCFRSISLLNVLHFCLCSVYTFIFQGHMKVALVLSDWFEVLALLFQPIRSGTIQWWLARAHFPALCVGF